MIARMLGFKVPRPITEGYFRILREKVFGRIAHGFGAVDLPEYARNPKAVHIGRQGEWDHEGLRRVDREITAMARGCARSEAGARTLRWYLLDQATQDGEPVDLSLIDQRLKNLGATIMSLFDAITGKGGRTLSDARIARYTGAAGEQGVAGGYWKELRAQVLERVDDDVFAEEPG
jgi:hypothetical protein